jgi:hypothetical protein
MRDRTRLKMEGRHKEQPAKPEDRSKLTQIHIQFPKSKQTSHKALASTDLHGDTVWILALDPKGNFHAQAVFGDP